MMSSTISLIIPLIFICCQLTHGEKVSDTIIDGRRRLPAGCEPGFEFDTDGVTCIDINECDMYNGGCSNICVNTEGSFMCVSSLPTSVPTTNPTTNPIIPRPINDLICNAIDITAYAPIDERIVGASTIDSTLDSPPADFCGTGITTAGVWYKLIIPNGQNGDVAYKIEVEDGSNTFDTKLSVYTADACDGALTCVAGNDDGLGLSGFGSRVEFQGTFNEVYVLLHGFGGATGTTNLLITSLTAAPTMDPTSSPSTEPTAVPTSYPSTDPTMNPTIGCGANNGGCQQICLDEPDVIPYSFECGCNAGYILQDDGVSCADINECNDGNNGGCEQRCTNLDGSYECSCNDGFRLKEDEMSCGDIDECSDGTYSCDENAYCKNREIKKSGDKGYKCQCNPGYSGDGITYCIPSNGKPAAKGHPSNPAMAMHYEKDDDDLVTNDDVINFGIKNSLSVWSSCMIATLFLYFVF